jgi:hypothetical protein
LVVKPSCRSVCILADRLFCVGLTAETSLEFLFQRTNHGPNLVFADQESKRKAREDKDRLKQEKIAKKAADKDAKKKEKEEKQREKEETDDKVIPLLCVDLIIINDYL